MSAIDLLAQIADELYTRRVACLSLGDGLEPLKIYMDPLTTADIVQIERHAKGNDFDRNVWTLIFCAKDEAGNKLFTKEDLPKLRRLPALLIAKLMADLGPAEADLDMGKP